ncbi:methyltransferase [Streptomyces sp. RerS4]|uniref:methyltransferase n=1 Tax=Streptomyces sp. RerS4 TaxID=2942449 RepID=UPI00201BB8C7|nr:methyltransferase [Streptomyces sp. RerS4]UQX04631.1 hypothetical protein M4D82_32050 [Streptomyces sp. RerS4]
METHYAAFGDLLHTARTGEAAATHHYGQPFFDWISADAGWSESQNLCCADITRSLRSGTFDGYRLPEGAAVADIGGADGTVLASLLREEPDRRGIVFDFPKVVAAAAGTADQHGLGGRLRSVGGNFFDSVPTADVYVLSYVLHDRDDLRRCS